MGTNNTPISIKSTTLSVEGTTTFSQDINTPNIFCNDALYLNDYQSLPTPTTYSSILVQNTDILNFDANFNNNKFQFKVSSNAVLLLDATNTTIYNNLNSLSQATFSNLCPKTDTDPAVANDLVKLSYLQNNFVDKTTAQTGIAGNKTFTGIITINNNLVSNNITAPSSTINGINNIFTNLDPNGYGVINIGAQGDAGPLNTQNQINMKSKVNIVESYYGGNPTKITTIQQEGNSCRFTNNGSTNGSFIFEINESGTYNPLVINKTSVDIARDNVISGDLILYDTTPSTKMSELKWLEMIYFLLLIQMFQVQHTNLK